MDFSNRLKELRYSKQITQFQAAYDLGMAESAYRRYELGMVIPRMDTLIALADYFDVPLDFLAGRGIFKDWDLIKKYKEYVLEAIIEAFKESNIVLMDKANLIALNEIDFIQILYTSIKSIKFVDCNGKMSIYVELYPFFK